MATQTTFIHRCNESSNKEFTRTGRFLTLNGCWFFKTREGFNYGPYANKTECRYAYDEFIEVVSNQVEFDKVSLEFETPAPTDSRSQGWKVPKINFS